MLKAAIAIFSLSSSVLVCNVRSQPLPVSVSPGASEGEVEVTLSSGAPVAVFPAYSQTSAGIRSALYDDLAWSSFVGFALQATLEQTGVFLISVVNLHTSQVIDQSCVLEVTSAFDLPEYNLDLSIAMTGTGAQVSRRIVAGTMSRGGSNVYVFGLVTELSPPAGAGSGPYRRSCPSDCRPILFRHTLQPQCWRRAARRSRAVLNSRHRMSPTARRLSRSSAWSSASLCGDAIVVAHGKIVKRLIRGVFGTMESASQPALQRSSPDHGPTRLASSRAQSMPTSANPTQPMTGI